MMVWIVALVAPLPGAIAAKRISDAEFEGVVSYNTSRASRRSVSQSWRIPIRSAFVAPSWGRAGTMQHRPGMGTTSLRCLVASPPQDFCGSGVAGALNSRCPQFFLESSRHLLATSLHTRNMFPNCRAENGGHQLTVSFLIHTSTLGRWCARILQ